MGGEKAVKGHGQKETHESSPAKIHGVDPFPGLDAEAVGELEDEFLRLFPFEEYAKRWSLNDSEWAQAASSMVASLHDKEVARTQSVTQKSHLILTSSFVALGVIGWVIVTFLRDSLPITMTIESLWREDIPQLTCIASACLSAASLLSSILWALRSLRPVIFTDISIQDALRLSRDDRKLEYCIPADKEKDDSDLREFCARRIYLDWECAYVRNKLNGVLFSSYSRAWHRFAVGITLLSIAWFIGLVSRM
jgi:hypothetical protein